MNKSLLKNFLCITLWLVVSVVSLNAQSISTHISDDSLRAGDTVTLSITLSRNKNYQELIFPDSAHFKSSFEIRDQRRYHISNFEDSITYQLQFWGVGNDTIQPLPVTLIAASDTTVIYTQPVPIAFKSLLKSKKPELKPLKPIFEFARAWWLYLLIFLIVVAIAAAIWYYYKKQQAKPEPAPAPTFKPEPFLNPLKELNKNLSQLKNVPNMEEIDYEQFYVDLGDAIRLYFERIYNMPALESTSGEIMRALQQRDVGTTILEDSRAVLNEADMVKFAKFKPSHEQVKKALDKANSFYQTVHDKHQRRVRMMHKQHSEQVQAERQAFNEAQNKGKTA